MQADWSRYVGLALATLLLIYLIVRSTRPLITGVFEFWRGVKIHKEDNRKDFALCTWLQIAGTLLFLAVYAYVVYDRFAADFGWVER